MDKLPSDSRTNPILPTFMTKIHGKTLSREQLRTETHLNAFLTSNNLLAGRGGVSVITGHITIHFDRYVWCRKANSNDKDNKT
jgi:hypothetical protein